MPSALKVPAYYCKSISVRGLLAFGHARKEVMPAEQFCRLEHSGPISRDFLLSYSLVTW
jgi:hypothetical protein